MTARQTASDRVAAWEPKPGVTAELFAIPIENGQYLVYAPLRQAAFVANGRVVNFLAGLRQGQVDLATDSDGTLVAFLRGLGIVDG